MRTETVRLNDVDLCYASEGTGTPLVLLHGGTGCHKDWAYAGYDQFVREYLVIRPDARGHGATGNSQATITHRHARSILLPCSIISELANAVRLE
jgi:pimeloyl-ACP methyl ester carboxylesterase